MEYQNEKIAVGNFGQRFTIDRRKQIELFDDCLGEALTKRAVPLTIFLSGATYLGIREGFLKNNGLFGMMRKNFLCMFIGLGISLIGIRENYNDKLAVFYNTNQYNLFKNLIMSDWKEETKRNKNAVKPFEQPNHLNLDLERPYFEDIDTRKKGDENHGYIANITYEELQRRNREKYAKKHNTYY